MAGWFREVFPSREHGQRLSRISQVCFAPAPRRWLLWEATCSKCKEATRVNDVVSQRVGCSLQKGTGPVPPGTQTPLTPSPLLAFEMQRAYLERNCKAVPFCHRFQFLGGHRLSVPNKRAIWEAGERAGGERGGKGLLLKGGRRAPPCPPAPVLLV